MKHIKRIAAAVLALCALLALTACGGLQEKVESKLWETAAPILVQGNMDLLYKGVCDENYLKLVLESNHDVDRLRSGPYPYSLKQRVLGSQGHLSNEDAAAFAARMATCGTECIVLAHLSKENNTPQLAYDAVDRALRAGGARVRLYVAPRDELSPAYETERTPCRR